MDSCITSPREPVLITRPLPLTADDSMVSNSPPTWVQAKPVTCPTWFSLSARPKSNLRTPRYSSKELESIVSSSAFLDLTWLVTTLRSEEHTSELQSRGHLVCRLLLEKKKNTTLN